MNFPKIYGIMDLSKREKTISATQRPLVMSSCLAPLWKILTGAPSHKFAASVFPKFGEAASWKLQSAASSTQSAQPPAKKENLRFFVDFHKIFGKRKKKQTEFFGKNFLPIPKKKEAMWRE